MTAKEHLRSNKELILSQWVARITTSVPAAATQDFIALRDAIPTFLNRLIDRLPPVSEKDAGVLAVQTSREHGSQRARLEGYSLTEMLHEYVILRRVLFAHLDELPDLTEKERDIVVNEIQRAMVEAADEFAEHQLDLERERNQELVEFGYIVSHDLKEPLRTARLLIGLVRRDYKEALPEPARKLLADVDAAAYRMYERVEALHAYSLLDRKVARKPTKLAPIIENILQDLAPMIEKAGAKIEVGELPEILCNWIHIGLVFQNLIENALKFHDEKPLVIKVSAAHEPPVWHFTVTDNGIGFDAGKADAIFKVFQRLHSSEEFPGSGIGLTVCKKIVERHGGKIWADSQPGKGSVFHFTIPAAG